MGAKNVESSPLLLLSQIYPYESRLQNSTKMKNCMKYKEIDIFDLVNSS